MYGNLLSLPFGGGMLYVEPVYVKSTNTNSYPLMRKVLLSLRRQFVAYEDTSAGRHRQPGQTGDRRRAAR